MTIRLPLFLLILSPLAMTANASPECDCSKEIALCQVLGDYEGGQITLTSYTEQCSRVTYRVNDVESTRIITGGSAIIQWHGEGEPRVRVERCRICDYRSNTRDDQGVRIQ